MSSSKFKYILIVIVLLDTVLLLSAPTMATCLNKLTRKVTFARFNESSCNSDNGGNNSVYIAVGFKELEYGSILEPLIVQSTDKGLTYHEVTEIQNYNTSRGTLLTASCQYIDNHTMCLAAGYLGRIQEESIPFLIRTNDSGKTWTKISIDVLKKGFIKKINCTASSTNTFCVGVGWDPNGNGVLKPKPLLIQSSNAGQTWEVVTTHLPREGTINDVSCTGESTNVTCVAIGFDKFYNNSIIVQTNNSGKEWSNPELHVFVTLNSVSCVGNGNKAVCAIVGKNRQDKPIVIQTKDGGANWTNELPIDRAGEFVSTSCKMKNEKVVCIAGGNQYLTPSYSILALAESSDGGKWTLNSPNDQIPSTYYGLSCNNTGQICIIVGNLSNGKPTIVESVDSGNHWQRSNIDYAPMKGILKGPSCGADIGKNTICLGVGYKMSLDADFPLIVQSRNGGIKWSVKDF